MFHLLNAMSELLEVRLLRGAQSIFPKERNHNVAQVGSLTHHKSIQRFVVIVVPSVGVYGANSEVLFQGLEALNALGSLRNREFMRQLIPSSVAGSVLPVRLSHQAD